MKMTGVFYINGIEDVIYSQDLFCIDPEKTIIVTDSGYARYWLDNRPGSREFILHGDSEFIAERAWAYLLSKKRLEYDGSQYRYLADSPYQQAIWIARAGYNSVVEIMLDLENITDEVLASTWNLTEAELAEKSDIMKEAYKILKESYTYAKFYYNTSTLEDFKINSTNAVNVGNTVGPFTIEGCSAWVDDNNNVLKLGVEKITVLDESNNELEFDLFYYNNSEKVYVNNMQDFNKIMQDGFYIEFKSEPESTYAIVKATTTGGFNPTVKLKQLRCYDEGITENHYWFCNHHSSDNGIIGGHTIISGPTTTTVTSGTTLTDVFDSSAGTYTHYELLETVYKYACPAHPSSRGGINTKCSVATGWCQLQRSAKNGANTYSCPNHTESTGSKNSICNAVTKTCGKTRTVKTSEVDYYKYKKEVYKVCTVLLDTYDLKTGARYTGYCGGSSSYTPPYTNNQRLIHVTSESSGTSVTAETRVDLIPRVPEMSLLKVNKDTGNRINQDVTFNISISNIKSFSLDKGNTNKITVEGGTYTNTWTLKKDIEKGKLSIYNVELVDKEEDVVVTIEEISEPNGYVGVSGVITLKLSYDSKELVLDEEYSDFAEAIYENGILQVKVKNEQKPKTGLRLTKIDDYTSEGLEGVKFTGQLENVISSETFEEVTSFAATADENGNISLNNYMINDITKPVKITITETEVPSTLGFYYKILDNDITITLVFDNGNLKLNNYTYDGPEAVTVTATNDGTKDVVLNISIPNKRKVDLNGQVWLDGDTILNNKTNGEGNGIKDNNEVGVPNVLVYLYNSSNELVKSTTTDDNGEYTFENIEYDENGYYIVFEYDGINYERTIDGDSDATEDGRETFNDKFHTITNGTATNNDGTETTTLTYETETTNGIQKSTLITTGDRTVNGTQYPNVVLDSFKITATSENIKTTTNDINLGLVLRGTDLAASNKVSTARVTINGEETSYTYNSQNNAIDVNKKSSEEVSYNLNIRKSDYTYRIRDYVNNEEFVEKEYTDNTENGGNQSGDELKVYVTYQVDLTNQSPEIATVNQLVYNYDSRYVFNATETSKLNILSIVNDTSANTLTINTNTEIAGGASKPIYLVFELSRENIADNAEYYNAVEITSYSTEEGLIDIDSEPGNLNYNKNTHTGNFEDDSDEAGGVKVSIKEDNPRTVSGYVFEDSNKNGTMASDETKVNDVIVQLIELKTINNKQYEYIWEETVSGSGKLKKLSNDGQSIETKEFEAKQGYYEFSGFIPGNYIVRFIYGDGTTYDLTGNVLKYNGQDYKSTIDTKYNEEMYNPANYESGASVARDNEARRLDTMSYAVNVDANKGILLKLLDVQTANGLNEVEKETITALYNSYYDPDISKITDEAMAKLLREQTLRNTWMCAETSRINVGVDSNVDLENVYFGLAKRPATEIELNKYITGFKLTASNGQVLVNARVDVEKYFEEGGNISDHIEGIKDSIQAINDYWKYEVDPTTINNIVEGATLEFDYTVVVRNIGEKDYLSNTLMTAYGNNDYSEYLKTTAAQVKAGIKEGSHAIGSYLGSYYYNGTIGSNKEALTEITDIRDYVRNDLKYVSGTNNVELYNEPAGTKHYVLNTDYSLGTIELSTVFKTGETSGKLASGDRKIMYAVTLQAKTVLSAAGNMDFYNYIAEVMSYTNAAGRRAQSSTPANAEIIDNEYREGREHEIDEAATADIQIGAATGEDIRAPYVWLITIVAGGVVIAAGAYTTKKFIIKK